MTNNPDIIHLPLSVNTYAAEQTESLGRKLAAALLNDITLPRFIALYGDLGTGKTVFVRGFVSQIAPAAIVKSPTFALVHEYNAAPAPVFHFDMYRINSEDELYSTGFYDYFARGGIILAEWSENIPYALPERYIKVNIAKANANETERRLITISLIDKEKIK